MIKIGTSLRLQLKSAEDETENHRCKIVEQSSNLLFIDYPISEKSGRTSIFLEGTEFSASFVGEDNSVYQFNTEIKGREKRNIPVLLLSFAGERNLIKVQRRKFVRVETAIDISIHDPKGTIPSLTTVTQDLSGGGCSIILPKGYSINTQTELEIWMILPMNVGKFEYIDVLAQAVRFVENHSEKPSTLSLEFIDIDDKDKQTIIRYCFEQQLKIRTKETR